MTDTNPARSEVSTFVEDLQRELRARKLSLLDAEFLTNVEAGTVTRDQIGRWATAFYAATRNGRISLGNFYANSPDDPELRRELAENIYEEETGRISGVGKCHMDVFADLLEGLGIRDDDVDRVTASGTGPQGRTIPAEDFYVELSAYGLSIESPNAEFCARLDRALRDNYAFTPRAVGWFTMHAALDAQHGEEFRKYVARAASAPAGLIRVREQTLALSATAKAVWDGFGSWR